MKNRFFVKFCSYYDILYSLINFIEVLASSSEGAS